MVDPSMTFDPKDELKAIEDYFKEYWPYNSISEDL